MKKLTMILTGLFLSTLLFFSGSCTGNYSPRIPSGDIAKQERDVTGFNALDVGGAFEVYLIQGSKELLTVEADADIIDKIITEVRGNTLKVYTEKGCCNNVEKMAIYLTFVDLKYIDISGACELSNEGFLKLDKLEMELSGASEINLKMSLNQLDIDLSGASEINFEGTCDQVYLDASGASELDATGFNVNKMTIDASGASECKVNVSDELHIEASGATEVRYLGNPKVSTSSSGASTVKPMK